MQIYINDEATTIQPDQSLHAVLQQCGIGTEMGAAVALNDEIVPKSRWRQTTFQENDRLLIVKAAQGG